MKLKKIFFSRTSWPILTKLRTMQPWVMRTQVFFSNEGPHLFPKGNNYQHDDYMCLLIWTVFSGERCSPCASCTGIPSPFSESLDLPLMGGLSRFFQQLATRSHEVIKCEGYEIYEIYSYVHPNFPLRWLGLYISWILKCSYHFKAFIIYLMNINNLKQFLPFL